MRVLAQHSIQLPARQSLARLWLDQLCQVSPSWNRAALEPLALHALADFYRCLDDGDVEPRFDLRAFLDANVAPERLSLIEIARIFIGLRHVLRQLFDDDDAKRCLLALDWLDSWSDRVIARYTSIRSSQLQERKAEIAQRMSELNVLNYCAATLNATLDSVSVLNATAQLACTLTNADLGIVWQREGDLFHARAVAGTLHYTLRTAKVTDPDLLQSLIVDEQRQDLSIAQVRETHQLPEAQAMCCIPLRAGDEIIGKLTLIFATPQCFTPQQLRLQQIFASHAGQAVRNAQLFERLSELTVAQERQRIACEMHDTMLQTLVSLNINLQVALNHARQQNWTQVAHLIEDSRQLGKVAIAEGRETLNSLRTDCSDVSTQDSLLDAIQPELHLFADQSGIMPRLIVSGDSAPAIPKTISHHLRRLVGEALTNVFRHARATEVTVRVDTQADAVWLQVQDNGIGFVPGLVDQQHSFGLIAMRERARFIGADLDIKSAPSRGTTVIVRVERCEC